MYLKSSICLPETNAAAMQKFERSQDMNLKKILFDNIIEKLLMMNELENFES